MPLAWGLVLGVRIIPPEAAGPFRMAALVARGHPEGPDAAAAARAVLTDRAVAAAIRTSRAAAVGAPQTAAEIPERARSPMEPQAAIIALGQDPARAATGQVTVPPERLVVLVWAAAAVVVVVAKASWAAAV